MSQTEQQNQSFLTIDELAACLEAAGEIAYSWQLAEDRISWCCGAPVFFARAPGGLPRSGRAFAALLAPETAQNPYDAVMSRSASAPDDGAAYSIQYALNLGGEKPVWVEDSGRCFAAANGRPAMAIGIIGSISERHKADEELRYLSNHDPLTGALNQGRLAGLVAEEFCLCRQEHKSFAFLLTSIDNLSSINAGYGFEIGDEVLVAISQRIRRHMRGHDDVGRFSGNKFGILLRHCNASDMAVAGQRLMDAVCGKMIETSAGPVAISLSAGGIVGPAALPGSRHLLAEAHEALSQAKSKSRGLFVPYEPGEDRTSARQIDSRIAETLLCALNERRITLACQPVVQAFTRRTGHYEALLRIAGKEGDDLQPGLLVPAAERLGLSGLLDHRVLELALELLSTRTKLRLAINISARTTADRDWLQTLAARLVGRDDLARRLTVEITESAAILDIEESAKFLQQIKSLGAYVAIDDFGAGHTSFRYLREMKVDAIKIDGSYISGLSQSRENQIFVRTIIGLARELGIRTVAEWVENEDDAQLLESWGIDFMQGHLFGQAVDLDESADLKQSLIA